MESISRKRCNKDKKTERFGEAAKPTAVCLGVDISGMYLSNLMRDMPTGSYTRQRKCNKIKN